MSNLDKNFLIVQYPFGAAGKFLSSVLMGSTSVAHFDPVIEQYKNLEKCFHYITDHFTKKIDDWLVFEPKPVEAWDLHFFSSTYDRGNQLTASDFLENCKEHASAHFWNCVSDKNITIAWHKTYVPEFLRDAKFITVIVDPLSIKWYHRALWYKHYGIKDNKIHLKTHDPYYNPAMQQYYRMYQNSAYSNDTFRGFVRKNIINNPQKIAFTSQKNFITNINQEFVLLSNLLNRDTFPEVINRICKKFKLNPIESRFLTDSHAYWTSCHEFKYSNVY